MRKTVTLGLVVASLGCFVAAGRLHAPLLALRRSAHLNQADPMENMPPLVAFTTVALGGFRGILADILWMRATTLQDEGKYFELVQLADWITKLQPRFASVWSFQGWNLAYNISVILPNPADRWRWVRHGIGLLRDEGLRYNPGSASLYKELSWLFFHKIGNDIDQAHWHYKKEWAAAMEQALGGARPDFAALRAAPVSPEALLANPAVAALVERLRQAGADPLDAARRDPTAYPEAVQAALRDDPAAPALQAYLRARSLRDVYRMDPARMEEVDRAYGPFDWRLPWAHAVYWAAEGLTYARGFDQVALRRAIFQAEASAFVRGRLVSDPARKVFMLTPNFESLENVRKAYQEAIRALPEHDTYRTAYANFLTDAVMVAFSYNRQKTARELYAELQASYPGERTKGDMESFVFRTYREFLGALTPEQTLAVIESAFYQSAFWKAWGDEDQAEGYDRLARLCWNRFMEDKTDPAFRARMGLPPLETIRAEAAARAARDLRANRAAPGAADGAR